LLQLCSAPFYSALIISSAKSKQHWWQHKILSNKYKAIL
jgi:hypothetical protein